MPMVHDMSLTDKYAIVYDLPVTVNFDLISQGYGFPFAWAQGRPARVGLIPREGTADDIIWCDVNPCYVFHPLNAYDTREGTVVIDLCRYETVMTTEFRGPLADAPTLNRWTIDPVTRKVHETTIDDRPQEFPRHNPKFGLKRHRFGYTAEFGPQPWNIHAATLKVDVENGVTEAHEYGFGRGGAEPVFVPRQGATEEDAGWIFSLVYDATTDQSELCILDAQDITGPEVARIHLPQRVPFGFHGNWVPDSSVPPN
jgi:carotenoid cleavage dioxygenase-like enzyme